MRNVYPYLQTGGEGLEEPRGMREVPLRRAGKGLRLKRMIFYG